MSRPKDAIASLLAFTAAEELSAEEVEAELRAAGVDVDVFLARLEDRLSPILGSAAIQAAISVRLKVERSPARPTRQGRVIEATEIDEGDEIVIADVDENNMGEVHHGVVAEAQLAHDRVKVVFYAADDAKGASDGGAFSVPSRDRVVLVKRHGAESGVR